MRCQPLTVRDDNGVARKWPGYGVAFDCEALVRM
jgi:hypothetical protein